MPLPSLRLFGAQRCTAKAKSTGQRCNNVAAWGCSTCRMHGARKRASIKRGEAHPNYLHGECTLATRADYSAASKRLRELEETAFKLRMLTGRRTGGRKPK